jgi:hypothetical protein
MMLSQADLLDTQDYEEVEESAGGTVTRQTEKSKDLTSAGRYQKSITQQLGNPIRYKFPPFLAYRKKYPLLKTSQEGGDQSTTLVGERLPAHDPENQSSPDKKDDHPNLRPRLLGSMSHKPRFDLGLKTEKIEEEQEEVDDSREEK